MDVTTHLEYNEKLNTHRVCGYQEDILVYKLNRYNVIETFDDIADAIKAQDAFKIQLEEELEYGKWVRVENSLEIKDE